VEDDRGFSLIIYMKRKGSDWRLWLVEKKKVAVESSTGECWHSALFEKVLGILEWLSRTTSLTKSVNPNSTSRKRSSPTSTSRTLIPRRRKKSLRFFLTVSVLLLRLPSLSMKMARAKGSDLSTTRSTREAQAAVDALHEVEQNGRKLFVTRAQKKAECEEELRHSYEQAKMEKMSICPLGPYLGRGGNIPG
jgi:hypothetical protein